MPFPAPYAKQIGEGVSEPIIEMIKEHIEKGTPIPTIPILIPTKSDKLIDVAARAANVAVSPDAANAGITFLSVRTAGQSVVGFLYTKDQVAKTFTSHSFRIGFITKLWKDSKDLEFVKQTIGHRKLDTTSAYVNQLSDQERQKRIDQLE